MDAPSLATDTPTLPPPGGAPVLDYKPAPDAPPSRLWIKLAFNILKLLVLLAVFYYVGKTLYRDLSKIDWRTLRIRPLMLVGATISLLGIYGLQMVSYRFLLAAFARRVKWRVMAAVAWVPLLGKYVPGKVVSVTGAIFLLRKSGVPAPAALSSVVMLDALPVVAGLMLGSPLLLTPEVRAVVPGGPILMAVVTVGGLIAILPAVFTRLVNFGLKILKRPPLPREAKLKDYALPACAAFGQWLAGGMALWFISRAMVFDGHAANVGAALIPRFISICALSMTVSYLTLLAPGGLGVREGLLLITLGPVLGPQAAGVVSVALRVIQVCLEITLCGIGWLLVKSAWREDSVTA